jgi:hypothetical protein
MNIRIKLFLCKIKHFTPIFFDMLVKYFTFAMLTPHKQLLWQKLN